MEAKETVNPISLTNSTSHTIQRYASIINDTQVSVLEAQCLRTGDDDFDTDNMAFRISCI